MSKYVLFFLLFIFQTIFLNASQNIQKVSLQLQWKHQFEFAGYYMAKEKGFYKDAGLEVEIKEFEQNIDIVNDVENSKATYGINYSNLVQDLIEGKTDLMSCFIGNEPFILDEKNIAYDIWDPKDYGFDFYDIILFTSLSELTKHPKRVEAFRTASLKGWEYAFSNIQESVEVILKKYNTQGKTKEAFIYEAKVLKKLAFEGSDTLGYIDKTKIKNIYGVYNLINLVDEDIDLNSFVYAKATRDIGNRYKIDYEIIKNILIVMLFGFFLIGYL